MAELAWTEAAEPASLRRALRHALRRRSPELRVVAEGFLATASPIDLLAVGADGELVSIRIAPVGGAAEGALLLTRALADLSWLGARAADLAALSPELGLAIGAEPRALLIAPDFDVELLAAREALPLQRLELLTWRGLRLRGQLELILEAGPPGGSAAVSSSAPGIPAPPAVRSPAHLAEPGTDRVVARPGATPADPPLGSGFRTGLTDADLQVDPRDASLH